MSKHFERLIVGACILILITALLFGIVFIITLCYKFPIILMPILILLLAYVIGYIKLNK